MKFFESVSGAAERDAGEKPPDGQEELSERNGKREAANPFVIVGAKEKKSERTKGGKEDQDGEKRSGGH
jgi:hypothetical protein